MKLIICTICAGKWCLKHSNESITEWLLLIDNYHFHLSSVLDSNGHFKANQLTKESFWMSTFKSHFKMSHFQMIHLKKPYPFTFKLPLQRLIRWWQNLFMGEMSILGTCEMSKWVKWLILNWIIFKMSHFQPNSFYIIIFNPITAFLQSHQSCSQQLQLGYALYNCFHHWFVVKNEQYVEHKQAHTLQKNII